VSVCLSVKLIFLSQRARLLLEAVSALPSSHADGEDGDFTAVVGCKRPRDCGMTRLLWMDAWMLVRCFPAWKEWAVREWVEHETSAEGEGVGDESVALRMLAWWVSACPDDERRALFSRAPGTTRAAVEWLTVLRSVLARAAEG
jgi:hypothetical protein